MDPRGPDCGEDPDVVENRDIRAILLMYARLGVRPIARVKNAARLFGPLFMASR